MGEAFIIGWAVLMIPGAIVAWFLEDEDRRARGQPEIEPGNPLLLGMILGFSWIWVPIYFACRLLRYLMNRRRTGQAKEGG